MSEHDIDKYFRDHLKDVEEPIVPSDFSEFEKLAKTKRSGKWLYMLLLLPLLGVSAFFYYSSQSSTAELSINSERVDKPQSVETSFTESITHSSPELTEDRNSQSDIPTESEINNDDSEPFVVNENAKMNGQKSLNGMNPKPYSLHEEQNTGNEISDSKDGHLAQLTKDTRQTNNSANHLAPAIIPLANEAINAKNSNDNLKNLGSTSSAAPNSKAANVPGEFDSKESFSRNERTTTSMEADYQKLPLIDLSEIDLNVTPNLNSNIEKAIIPELKSWSIDIFAQYEFNNELGGIPSAGFISSWQKKKWNIGVGAGIGQTGTLNWTQTREDISYGFDKYETDYQLKTKNYTFISMPIHLAYRVLPRGEVFMGFTPQMIVNASQAYSNTESNQNQSSGYLYDTGAPSLLLFMNVGYGFTLTENLNLDLGIDYSPQNWNVTNKNPLGGFIRLKYSIR